MNCKIQVPKILVTVRVFCLFQRITGFSKTMRYINRHYLSIYLSILKTEQNRTDFICQMK